MGNGSTQLLTEAQYNVVIQQLKSGLESIALQTSDEDSIVITKLLRRLDLISEEQSSEYMKNRRIEE